MYQYSRSLSFSHMMESHKICDDNQNVLIEMEIYNNYRNYIFSITKLCMLYVNYESNTS